MATEDEIIGWHHQLDGHEFEQVLGESEGQGSIECCSPWGHKALDTTWQLNNSTAQQKGSNQKFLLVLFISEENETDLNFQRLSAIWSYVKE